jgi:hypothetical protein
LADSLSECPASGATVVLTNGTKLVRRLCRKVLCGVGVHPYANTLPDVKERQNRGPLGHR